MPVECARYIPDLLQTHAEELGFLWGQHREALQSQRFTLREYGELTERIEAHVQGLMVADAPALLTLLQPALESPDRDEVFAAAYALLRKGQLATSTVLAAFAEAAGPKLAGLRDALGQAPHTFFAAEMQSALDQASPLIAASAAVVLANHRLLEGQSPRLAQLLTDADPMACALAWRAASVVDAKAPQQAPARPFEHALTHDTPAVRSAGWGAVAWSGRIQHLPLLRERTVGNDPIALHWLSVLGTQDDVPLVQKAALAMEAPAARCALLARFGHPSALNALLRWMAGDDVALAVASGEAFTRITGIDIRGERSTMPVPDDADDFTREMAPAVWLPDQAKARAAMEPHSAEWAAGTRWCKGKRLDVEITREQLIQFDLEARWDTAARAALAGRRLSTPPPIH